MGGKIYNGTELLSEAGLESEHMVFKGLDFSLAKQDSAELSVRLDLAEDLNTGRRILLNIEKLEDIEARVGGKAYIFNAYYPIKGEYLSIVKKREWQKSFEMPEGALLEPVDLDQFQE